jgi:hypothetical protein
MFIRIAGLELFVARDFTKRSHGSRGAYRFAGGFEAWVFGYLLVVSRAASGNRWQVELGQVRLGAAN